MEIVVEIVVDLGSPLPQCPAGWTPVCRLAGVAGDERVGQIMWVVGCHSGVRHQLEPVVFRVDETDPYHLHLLQINDDLADLLEQLLRFGVADDGGAGSAQGGVEMAQTKDSALRQFLRRHVPDGRDRDFVSLVDEMADKQIGGENRTILASVGLIGKALGGQARQLPGITFGGDG